MNRSTPLLLAAGIALWAIEPPHASAQAWLAPAGEAFVSLGYSNVFVRNHFLGGSPPAGQPIGDNIESNRGHMRAHSFGAQIGYAITDRLEVTFGIPYVDSKWYPFEGRGRPHVLSNGYTLDDGQYHGTLQDFQGHVLYQVLREPVTLTPFVAAVIPSHDYIFFAHAAPGRNLREYLLGLNIGTRLDPILPRAYLQGSYSYAFVEKVFVEGLGDIHHDKSAGSLELGYFLTPSLGARFLAAGFYTHGGVSFRSPADYGVTDASNPLFLHHDQIGHDSALSLGGGLFYALTGSVDVYANYMRTVAGHGGHEVDHAVSVGFAWGFSPRQVIRRMIGRRTPADEGTNPGVATP